MRPPRLSEAQETRFEGSMGNALGVPEGGRHKREICRRGSDSPFALRRVTRPAKSAFQS